MFFVVSVPTGDISHHFLLQWPPVTKTGIETNSLVKLFSGQHNHQLLQNPIKIQYTYLNLLSGDKHPKHPFFSTSMMWTNLIGCWTATFSQVPELQWHHDVTMTVLVSVGTTLFFQEETLVRDIQYDSRLSTALYLKNTFSSLKGQLHKSGLPLQCPHLPHCKG